MSVAWYIVLDRKVPGLKTAAGGKALAHEGRKLNALAKNLGVTALMEFFSVDKYDDGEGGTLPGPPEQWFAPEEGLRTTTALLDHIRVNAYDLEDWDGICKDLRHFKKVLAQAQEHGCRWHLGVDY